MQEALDFSMTVLDSPLFGRVIFALWAAQSGLIGGLMAGMAMKTKPCKV